MLQRIAAGDSIRGAAKRLRKEGETVPSAARFIRWCQKTPERWQRYVRAQRAAAELHADRLDYLAAHAGADSDDPAMINAQVQRARLRIDTRKWTLAKRHPERYGDRVAHEHGGNVVVTVATGVTDDPPLPTARPEGIIAYKLGGDVLDVANPDVATASPSSASAGISAALRDGLAMLD